MEFDILANGIAALVYSIETFASRTTKAVQYKFVFLSFFQGIELLLKARLAQTHSVFIYQDIDHPTHLAGFETVLWRLRSVTRYPLAAHHLIRLRCLDRLRQHLLHEPQQLTEEQVAILIADSLPLLDVLLDQQFDIVLMSAFAGEGGWQALADIGETANQARQRADRSLVAIVRAARDGGPWPLRCPICCEEYLVQKDRSEGQCLYCQEQVPFADCPSCGRVLPEHDLHPITGQCPACVSSHLLTLPVTER